MQSSSLWHRPFGTLELCWRLQSTFLGWKRRFQKTLTRFVTHLSTETQPLIGGLYVICYYKEHLLTLQNKIKSWQ